MEYIVDIKEVWTRSFEVDAINPQEAIRKAKQLMDQGEEELVLEYSYEMDEEKWHVYEVNKDTNQRIFPEVEK